MSARFQGALEAGAAAVLGPGARVTIVAPGDGVPAAGPPAHPGASGCNLNPKYTFSQYVIGDGNRLAHAAALAVAEMPGQAYNPLFVYGAPGVGKTHLLHSIANYLIAHGSGLAVRYVTAEDFTNEFIHAVHHGGGDAFKKRYRNNDVLLVDDVQFLEHKLHTEVEFFHTFNALYEAGSQLVLASDRLPRDLDALEDRLRARFESGLITDIALPDLPTRRTFLRMRAQRDDIRAVEAPVLEAIAVRVDGNIRALEGALIRVVAQQSLTGQPVTPNAAVRLLDRVQAAQARRALPTTAEIQEATCRVFSISREELLSGRRTARIAHARHVAMYLARELTGETFPTIGRQFGNRNHTTVLHAHRSTTARLSADPETRRLVDEVSTALVHAR